MLESAVGLSVTATRQNEERSEYAAGAVFLPVAGGVNWPAPTTCACSIVAFFSVRVDRPSQDAAIAAIGLRTTTSAPTSTTARITSSQFETVVFLLHDDNLRRRPRMFLTRIRICSGFVERDHARLNR